MCENCIDISSLPDWLQETAKIWEEYLQDMQTLDEVHQDLPQKDQEFASSLIQQLYETGSLSFKQWQWVKTLGQRVTGAEPLYGDFSPIQVMFRLASANGDLKRPKIRLLSDEGTFVQLTFFPDREGSKNLEIHTGGWAGHGQRKFAGWIFEDKIIPYKAERMNEDIKNVIQSLALDPLGCAKAMASKLGACMYCGSRLTDEESKAKGYGPVCAENYELPWGNKTSEGYAKARELSTLEDLNSLF